MASLLLEAEPIETAEQWLNRYPAHANGTEQWREQRLDTPTWVPPQLPEPRELHLRLTRTGSPAARPRVFISHRQGDEKYARRIAWLADKHGFEFWLDTINMPPPAIVAAMNARSIALRIEMALLNCSHVVAAYTDNTSGSTWVPYEYGRVKQPVLRSTRCCAWLHTGKPVPEWVELNEHRTDEPTLEDWFSDEFTHWCARFPGCPTSKPVGYPVGTTTALP